MVHDYFNELFSWTGCLSPSENEAIDLQEDEIRAVETSGTNSTETAETKKKNDNAKQVKLKIKVLVIAYTIDVQLFVVQRLTYIAT